MLILDVETTVVIQKRGFNPSPYLPENYLVSIGMVGDITKYLCVQHNEQATDKDWFNITQKALDNTKLVVGHNLKFDLSWLFEIGLVYSGPIWDTMLVEYILSRGIKRPLDLSSCCKRYGIEEKLDITQEYLDKGVGFEAMPWPIVKEYGEQDCNITELLCLKQMELLNV